jgi:GMP synthase (glutamine-hydrolysing)
MSFIIIKTGSTLESLISTKGDFEDWFLQHLGLPKEEVQIINVQNNESLPDFIGVSGVLITGSHSMVSSKEDWSEKAAAWIKGAVEGLIPVLGVCFGHQLLAYALGGKVGPNPKGLEGGTILLETTSAAKTDPLFSDFDNSFCAQTVHFESVLTLPEGAIALAGNQHDPHHAFRYGDNAWGFQFHPEFDVEIISDYIRYLKQDFADLNVDSQSLIDSTFNTYGTSLLLQKFSNFSKNKASSR